MTHYKKLEIIVTKFSAEYHECGSHKIRLIVEIDTEDDLEDLKLAINS